MTDDKKLKDEQVKDVTGGGGAVYNVKPEQGTINWDLTACPPGCEPFRPLPPAGNIDIVGKINPDPFADED